MVNVALKRGCQTGGRARSGHAAEGGRRRPRRRPELTAADDHARTQARPRNRLGWAFGLVVPAAAAAIAANALLLQEAPHPEPWFAMRTMPDWTERPNAGRLALPSPRPHLNEAAGPASTVDGDPVVFAVQQALGRAGYGPLAPDGMLGPRTGTAIRRFQLDQGLAVTGQIDEALIGRLAAVGALDRE